MISKYLKILIKELNFNMKLLQNQRKYKKHYNLNNHKTMNLNKLKNNQKNNHKNPNNKNKNKINNKTKVILLMNHNLQYYMLIK